MNESNKVMFIINRFSGSGYREDLEGKFIAHCNSRSLECSIEYTKKQGHGTTLARIAVRKNYAMVFAVGGDGTVNEVAQGLLHSHIPLGIIPKGSGNGLARHLRIPLQIDKALAMLDKKNILLMDCFTINNQFSLNVSGIGFDGHVAGLFGKDGKRGLYGYGRLVISQFRKFNDFECQIQLDEKMISEKAFIISIANSSQFGNNAIIAPSASVSDQLLNVSIIKKMSVLQGIGFVTKLFNNSVDRSLHATFYQAKSIDIITPNEVPFHIDGEPGGKDTHFQIRIIPAALHVSIPPNAAVV